MVSIDKIEKTLNEIQNAKILVAGDLMLDTYLFGDANRISPEAPVPVVKLASREDRLGGAANCATNIAALGGEPVMMGAIGKREAGERFLNIVHEHGFSDKGILTHDYFLTTRKVRVVASGQQIVRVDEEEQLIMNDSFLHKAHAFMQETVPEVDAIAISDYAKGFLTPHIMNPLIDLSRQYQVPILADPKPVNAKLFRGCDLIKPNRKEASELSGIIITDDRSCDRAAAFIMENFSPRALLITRGPDGMDLYREGADPVRIRPKVSRVYDVSGAGDTVLAVLAMSWARKIDPVIACEIAAAAASVAVTKPGTSTVTTMEILESLRSQG